MPLAKSTLLVMASRILVMFAGLNHLRVGKELDFDVFLLSDASRYVVGQNLIVDDGFST